MSKITRHILIPLISIAIFFIVVSLPVELLGCRNRGLIAAVLALATGILGVFTAVKALVDKVRGKSNSFLWVASALIFAFPALFIVLTAT
jgi:hypothetical protein